MSLLESLLDFKKRFNDNEKVKLLLSKWDRCIVVSSDDVSEKYCIIINKGIVESVTEGSDEEGNVVITLKAVNNVLVDIFTGNTNPATAFLNGNLEVWGDDMDKIKLDALSLLLWG